MFLLFVENYLIPKSRNNGSDHDYVYLDTLTGDDVGEFLSFEKKCISNNFKQEIPDLLGKKHTNGKHQCQLIKTLNLLVVLNNNSVFLINLFILYSEN